MAIAALEFFPESCAGLFWSDLAMDTSARGQPPFGPCGLIALDMRSVFRGKHIGIDAADATPPWTFEAVAEQQYSTGAFTDSASPC
ncbi:MAG: hypothetical protein M3R60_04690 [Pseudomonadota bacterium]|nr:hypothetical protein [Pseudomonadota bacterium]